MASGTSRTKSYLKEKMWIGLRMVYMTSAWFSKAEDFYNDACMDSARYWYKKAAEEDHVEAQFKLADMMQRGCGGPVCKLGAMV